MKLNIYRATKRDTHEVFEGTINEIKKATGLDSHTISDITYRGVRGGDYDIEIIGSTDGVRKAKYVYPKRRKDTRINKELDRFANKANEAHMSYGELEMLRWLEAQKIRGDKNECEGAKI